MVIVPYQVHARGRPSPSFLESFVKFASSDGFPPHVGRKETSLGGTVRRPFARKANIWLVNSDKIEPRASSHMSRVIIQLAQLFRFVKLFRGAAPLSDRTLQGAFFQRIPPRAERRISHFTFCNIFTIFSRAENRRLTATGCSRTSLEAEIIIAAAPLSLSRRSPDFRDTRYARGVPPIPRKYIMVCTVVLSVVQDRHGYEV